MLHLALAVRAFRRYSTYVAATLAGIFTNSVFGIIYSYAYLALWSQRPDAGGYDAVDAVTFVWLGQALLMTVSVWAGGVTEDLGERIRTGDVAVDLYRPVNIVGWYLAMDLGRAAYHLLTRGLAPTLVGLALFDIRLPATPGATLGFVASVVLAVVVSFALRFLVACSAFWLLDASGPKVIYNVVAVFFSGMTLPLVLFPGVLGTVANVLPWSAIIQVPNDIWLGTHAGSEIVVALGFQAVWAIALLGACQLVLSAATRRVVVQGG